MIKRIQERIFPFIIALSALSVSASAAFYSVSGLSKLFAGAAFAVIVMAASLEVAKLVIASLLYQYRKSLPTFLKYYLSVACFVLILITSMGIYGFLSSAYQETAAKAGSIDSQIALEKQLDQAIDRQTIINNKVDGLNTKLFEYETEIVEVSINNDIAGELGPLKYLSGLTGIPMDKIINYLLLTIIFVFDPLAIALVIAANFAFSQLRPKIKENIYGEKVLVKEEETIKGKPVMVDPDSGNLYYEEDEWDIEEKELEEPIEIFKDDNLDLEEEINLEKKELENQIKTSSLSSWRISKGLSEIEKQFDLNKDGILSDKEKLNFLKRLRNNNNDNQITY